MLITASVKGHKKPVQKAFRPAPGAKLALFQLRGSTGEDDTVEGKTANAVKKRSLFYLQIRNTTGRRIAESPPRFMAYGKVAKW